MALIRSVHRALQIMGQIGVFALDRSEVVLTEDAFAEAKVVASAGCRLSLRAQRSNARDRKSKPDLCHGRGQPNSPA
jgi:hypothetical protein